MPKLVRLYIQSVAIGFAIAAAFTTGLLWLDVGGLGHLVLGSDIGGVALGMLVVFNGFVFSAVQFAFQVMAMADSEGPGSRRGLREPVLIPVPVKARAKR
jgi:hypothetical protein